MFTEVVKNKVPFTKGAAGDELNRINGTGIVLHNSDKFLVLRPFGRKFAERSLCNAIPKRKPWAKMSVELNGISQILALGFIHRKHFLIPDCEAEVLIHESKPSALRGGFIY